MSGLRFEVASRSTLTWNPAAFSDLYDVSRGFLSALDGSDYGSCANDRDPDPSDTLFEDGEVPPAADGFGYLVRGRSAACGIGGSWGTTSSGTERTNANPASCP